MDNNIFDSIPDVTFAPLSAQDLVDEMVRDYEQAYLEETGEAVSLAPASETRIFLYTQALRFYHAYQLIDRGFKMNLPKYSVGDYLDNLAALLGIRRLEARSSSSRVEFKLSTDLKNSVIIPRGTRVATPDNVFFATLQELVIPAGETAGECNVEAMEAGAYTNGFVAGQINVLVDPLPYVAEVSNLLTTQGGADRESDDSLRQRVFYFTDSLSVAGPESAYRYFVTSYSQAVEGVSIYSPGPGRVDIRLTLTGGELPEQPFLDGLEEYLEDKRPLTDQLNIGAPEIREYAVDCTYYIARSDQHQADVIRERVEQAVRDYIAWQGGQIGRDLSPDKLTSLVIGAGAKRVPIAAPVFAAVDSGAVPQCTGISVEFGGVEDD